jgi:hypothetical protein
MAQNTSSAIYTASVYDTSSVNEFIGELPKIKINENTTPNILI